MFFQRTELMSEHCGIEWWICCAYGTLLLLIHLWDANKNLYSSLKCLAASLSKRLWICHSFSSIKSYNFYFSNITRVVIFIIFYVYPLTFSSCFLSIYINSSEVACSVILVSGVQYSSSTLPYLVLITSILLSLRHLFPPSLPHFPSGNHECVLYS